MRIYIGSDHTGYEIKEKLKVYLSELGLDYEIVDKGAFKYDADDDYPDFIREVALSVANDPESEGRMGIVLGGSGQGEAMCANRISGVRAAVFYGEVKAVTTLEVEGGHSEDCLDLVRLGESATDRDGRR